jgi:hypothetical protein
MPVSAPSPDCGKAAAPCGGAPGPDVAVSSATACRRDPGTGDVSQLPRDFSQRDLQ